MHWNWLPGEVFNNHGDVVSWDGLGWVNLEVFSNPNESTCVLQMCPLLTPFLFQLHNCYHLLTCSYGKDVTSSPRALFGGIVSFLLPSLLLVGTMASAGCGVSERHDVQIMHLPKTQLRSLLQLQHPKC